MDSLKRSLAVAKEDSTRVMLLAEISLWSVFSNPGTSLQLARQGIKLAQQINYPRGEAYCKVSSGLYFWSIGDYTTTIKLAFAGMPYAEADRDLDLQNLLNTLLLHAYRDNGDYSAALKSDLKGRLLAERLHQTIDAKRNAMTASIYLGLGNLDSATHYIQTSLQLDSPDGWTCMIIGRVQAMLNHADSAFLYYKLSIKKNLEENNFKDLAGSYQSIAALYQSKGNVDSDIYYAKEGLSMSQQKAFAKEQLDLCYLLAAIYEKRNTDSALQYYKRAGIAKDNLFNREKEKQVLSFQFNEELRQWEIKSAEIQYKNRVRTYGFIAGFAVLAVIAFLQWRNNLHKQRAYTLLEKQKAKTDGALQELKETQAQLIQREKMASLGELTAGIAHEIQNPLNFVNNFSEVSTELCEELKEETKKDVIDKQLIHEVTDDIQQNLQKINFHGKRADSIVKNMMEHSRSSSGERQPTDLNALIDEYLRLSYHGMKARNKDFTVNVETNYDTQFGKVNVVPQNIGRVFLNLFNNAFYSLHQKKIKLNGTYEPVVSVRTIAANGKIEIIVRDNGMGIPQNIVNKIYQPFFTTKPTGEGTGLGLSLSYDIITKEHGGELKVDTKEGEYAEFTIQLPAK